MSTVVTLSPLTDTSPASSTTATTALPSLLSISTLSSIRTGSNTPLLSLRIPDIDQDDSSAAAVPFPRISQRRKLYRGVGTQPWHNQSTDSDSDNEAPQVRPVAVAVAVAPAQPRPDVTTSADPRRTYSESQITTSNPTLLTALYTTPLIRKKSGEVVKSSLKSPSQSSCASCSGSFSSRSSNPSTPTLSKIVHFDGQLEHVRLFREEQEPAAVSRGGSPADSETSDTEVFDNSEYRSSEDERLRTSLLLETVNIPLRNAMASTQERLGDLDVKLEQVILSKDGHAVEGTILVRNIAYEKWVAVRFTFDWWQTTNEVIAKHSMSIPEEHTDLFSFVIRLPDVTRKIEEKRLFFALRYVVAGREMWDNNRGENYQIRFRIEKRAQRVSPVVSLRPLSWPVKSANIDQMAELRKKIQRVVRDEEEEEEESSGLRSSDHLTAKLRAKDLDIEEGREEAKGLNLRSRYDFEASYKVKWQPPEELPKYGGPPLETRTIPFSSPRSNHVKAASLSWSPPQTSWRSPRGSPRDLSNDSAPNSPKFFIDPREAKHWRGASQPQSQTPAANATRPRHQRGGYFDLHEEGAASVVLTPTTAVSQKEATTMASSASNGSGRAITPDVLVTEENAEASSSETESTSSSASSCANDDTADGLSPEQVQTRAVRFNSYPMDKTYLSPSHPSSASVPPNVSASLAVPGQSTWSLSPQGSSSSVGSTPSITSASSPSQSPSSPSELSDSLRSIHQNGPNRPSLDSVDYSYFLTRFCYYTGHDNIDRHGLDMAYGSTHHQPSLSGSTMEGRSASWEATEGAIHRRHSSETIPRTVGLTAPDDESVIVNDATWVPSDRSEFESPDLDGLWSSDSGHATPTRSSIRGSDHTTEYGSPGKTTPRARSPKHAEVDLEATPRLQGESFVRPYRGSL